MTRALLVVDVQNDFCEGGALGVTGGNAVAQAISDYMKSGDRADYALKAASLDWHAAPPNTNCGHFALDSDPDYKTSWPVHCVKGTPGSGLKSQLVGRFEYFVFKGFGCQSYSAFEGVTGLTSQDGGGRSLLAVLRSADVTDLDVCGIATDYCVKATVLDALGTGFKVRVLSDLCAGVAEGTSIDAFNAMRVAGAELVHG